MIVYLDVDGVITDFCIGIYNAFNKPYKYPYLTPKYKFWDDWDGVTTTMVDSICGNSFWQTQPWIHDGLNIFEAVRHYFKPEQIYLITYPMPNVESPTGKWKWVKENLPGYYNRTIITQAPKHLLARPNTLLIDDKTQNVDEFRQAGGQTILVPRPWNSLHLLADKSVEIVKQQLAEVKCHESL